MLIEALIASVSIALLSLVGIFVFGRSGRITGEHRFVLPIAIGILLAVVFFELIPETLREAGERGSIAIVVGFLGFYLLSHLLHTYHHHGVTECDECERASSAQLILVGDGVHNIADGIVIASAFLVDPAVGIAATIGIGLHEVPQEIAEFSILVRAGYTKIQAALRNLISASSIVVGVLLTFLVVEYTENVLGIIIGLAAGNLLYIGATDLLPELDAEHAKQGHFWQVFLSVVVGLVLMASIIQISHEYFGAHAEDTPGHEEDARSH